MLPAIWRPATSRVTGMCLCALIEIFLCFMALFYSTLLKFTSFSGPMQVFATHNIPDDKPRISLCSEPAICQLHFTSLRSRRRQRPCMRTLTAHLFHALCAFTDLLIPIAQPSPSWMLSPGLFNHHLCRSSSIPFFLFIVLINKEINKQFSAHCYIYKVRIIPPLSPST